MILTIDDINAKFLELENIKETRHLNLWSLDGKNQVFTAHLILKEAPDYPRVLKIQRKIREILKPYDFSHSTIELELDETTSSLLSKNRKDED